MSFFDLDPDAVSSAGRSTARTSSTWESWAHKSETALRNAAGDVRQPALASAIEGYLSTLNPAMKRVARNVDALGSNTESASHTMSNSDTAANALLTHQGQLADGHDSSLRRPINP